MVPTACQQPAAATRWVQSCRQKLIFREKKRNDHKLRSSHKLITCKRKEHFLFHWLCSDSGSSGEMQTLLGQLSPTWGGSITDGSHLSSSSLSSLGPGWRAYIDGIVVRIQLQCLETFQPSNLPTFQPSNLPTFQPSNFPTFQLSNLLTFIPYNLCNTTC